MQSAAVLINDIKIIEFADLAHDGEADADGVAPGTPFFKPLK